MLKLKFPVDLVFRKATYEIPYGTMVKAGDGKEQPGQSWIDLSGIIQGRDEMYGLSILNDAKYSYSVLHKEVSLTVLRSPIYAHHDPLVPEEDGHYSFIDQGIQRFKYTLLPHTGSWEQAGTVRKALGLTSLPLLLKLYWELPQRPSAASKEMCPLKHETEEGDIILRSMKPGAVRWMLDRAAQWKRVIAARFGPYEIKTFRILEVPQPIAETTS